MTGRLNHFQRTMLHWNDLHPYNAIVAVRLPALLVPERLARIINGTLEAHGLTGLSLNRGAGTFHYAGGSVVCEIKHLAGEKNFHSSLHSEIETQLNTAFVQTERFNPFRFFTLSEPDGFWLGVVFLHVIADGEAIMLLVREMVETYLNAGDELSFQPLNLHPQCRDGLLAHPKMLAKKLAALPALIKDMRNSSRRGCHRVDDFSNRFTRFTLDSKDVRVLVKTAKAWDITLNDLFLSLMLKCFSGLASDRLHHRKRREISIGCIVNLRKDLGLIGQRLFAPFLGSFVVTHGVPGDIGLKELAADIRRQTLAIKQGRLYLGSVLEFAFGRFMSSWFSPARQKTFYAKNFPLWGGLTNINLNAFWPQSSGGKPLDCFAAAPTGPVVPLVFSFMTVGEIMNVTISYRPAFYSEANIGQVVGIFREQIAQLKS